MPVDLRALALTLAAVFLALGLGIVIGATRADGTLQAAQEAVLRGLEDEFGSLRDEVRLLRDRVARDERLVEDLSRLALAGRLREMPVRVVGLGTDANTAGAVAAVGQALGAAGALPVESFVLAREVLAAPAAADVRVLALDLAQAAEPAGAGLERLAAGTAGAEGLPQPDAWRPPAAVVLVRAVPESPPGDRLRVLVETLRTAGVRVVAYEPLAAESSLRATWRRLGVPAVSGLDGTEGGAAVVWLVLGAQGQYGPGPDADRLLPEPADLGGGAP